MNDNQEVLQANDGFYQAFNKQDLGLMERVWLDAEQSVCIHPGWPVLRGYESITQSWKDIFEHTDHMEIKLSDVEVVISGDLGWVSCQENLFSIHQAGVQTSQVHATNLFRCVKGSWRMILHHAAAVPPPKETVEE